MRKRILSLTLCLAVVLSGMAPVFAVEEQVSEAPEQVVQTEGQEAEQVPEDQVQTDTADEPEAAAESTETAEPETVAEPVAQTEADGEAESDSETAAADTQTLQEKVTAEVYKGNNVVDVSEYNTTVETASNAADEVTEENSAVTEASVGVDEDGNANVVVVEVDPVMAMAIAEANSTAYTEEEQDQIKAAYDDYFASITGDNAQYFGVLTPYFTAKETNGYPINALLSVASISLHDDGYYYDDKKDKQQTAQDIVTTISAFTIANSFAVNFYGSDVIAAKDEALATLDDSMTTPQKLLALNDWLAQKASFDMAYIMNSGKEKGEETLVAKNPQEHPKRQALIGALKQQLPDQLRPMIYQQIYNEAYQQVYDAAYEQAYEAAYEQILAQIKEENPDMSDEEAAAAAEEQAKAVADEQAKAAAEEQATQIAEENVDAETEKAVEQAAEQMADGIIGAWEGNQFGILAEFNSGVCLGYAYAYAYLVQWAFPEIYMEDGQFKDYKELNYEANQVEAKDEEGNPVVDEDGNPVMTTEYTWNENTPAIVDFVRIDFDTEVRTLGEYTDFGDVHYWNAAKVDGEWYYIDPCYTDIYVECMSRDRVETNGNMNHLYFMFSDTNCRELYDGYYTNINTLYENIATDTTYEDAWFAFAKSPAFVDGDKWYYFYNSDDVIEQKTNYENMSEDQETEYKLVYHDGSVADADGTTANADFVTLVDFNNGKILQDGELVDSELLQELWEKHKTYTEDYPSIITSCAPADGKLYFNIANCIMSYDLSSGELVKFKEYNKVSASRDDTVVFGGMGFSVVEDGTEGALTVENNPIAGMTIKDGKMYVDVATNYAYISGQEVIGSKTHEIKEDKGYGWDYEETNYNSAYNIHLEDMLKNNPEFAELMGYEDQDNDNDEFMWSANFVDTIEMSHLTGSDHEYEQVTVDPFCGMDGFTENRCKTCGAIEDGTRETVEGTAVEHHYVAHHEVYYEKDDDGNFLEGDAYVCVICKDAQEEQPENMGEHTYNEEWKWAEDYSSATVTLTCVVCSKDNLDCMQGLEEADYTQTVDAEITTQTDEDGNIVYTATATVGDKTYTDEKTVEPKLAITTQPSDYTGEVGENAVFTIEATGEGLTYQWQYQNVGTDFWQNSSQSGNKTASLSVPITEKRNGQKYRCVVTDASGNTVTSDEATLLVAQKDLQIVSQPSDYTGAVGDTATFTIEATGTVLTYQWQYQNVGTDFWQNSSQSGNKTATLSVPITEKRNGQKYRCVVTDADGNSVTSDEATLSVEQEELQIVSQPSDYTGTVGDTATFTIEATGTGLTYQWQYQNVGTDFWQNSSQSGNKTATLSVPITEKRNGQKYRCVVTDASGNTVTSNEAVLRVDSGLAITTQPSDYTGAVGDTATFTIEATGEGLTYQWQYQNVGTDFWQNSSQSGNKTATLSIPITEKRNGQKYRCVVTDASRNTVTSDEATLLVAQEELQIVSQPSDYTGEVGENAVFTIEATGTGLTYQWQYQNVGTDFWQNSSQSGNKTTSLSVPITEQRNGQKYRCVVTDVSGNSVTSDPAAIVVK
ncbi:MAG: hypothetical protein ACI3XY_08540 [Butyricicoccaceae bacterium]